MPLFYSSDSEAGFARVRKGVGFAYGKAPPARPVRGLVAAEQRLLAFLRRASRKKAACPTPGARGRS